MWRPIRRLSSTVISTKIRRPSSTWRTPSRTIRSGRIRASGRSSSVTRALGDLGVVDLQQAGHAPEQGGLAGAVGAEQRHDLAVRDAQAHPAQGQHHVVVHDLEISCCQHETPVAGPRTAPVTPVTAGAVRLATSTVVCQGVRCESGTIGRYERRTAGPMATAAAPGRAAPAGGQPAPGRGRVGPVLAEVREGLGMSRPGRRACSPRCRCSPSRSSARWPRHWPDGVGVHRVTLAALGCVVGRPRRPRAVDHASEPSSPSRWSRWPGWRRERAAPVAGQAALPRPVGRVTALYTTTLAIGLTGALTLTVPIVGGGQRLARRAGRLGGPRPASRRCRGWRWSGHDRHPEPIGARSPSPRWPAPGWASHGGCSSGSSRCRPTRSSAGSPSSGATRATPPSPPGALVGLVGGVEHPVVAVAARRPPPGGRTRSGSCSR